MELPLKCLPFQAGSMTVADKTPWSVEEEEPGRKHSDRTAAERIFGLICAKLAMPEQKKKYHTPTAALQKLQRYCAYQDRCHMEVRSKLLSLGIYGDDLEMIMADLIEEDFLNEERFARSYARGKFRFKCWGRLRISRELKSRKISDYLIRKALEEIPKAEYRQALHDFLERKLPVIRADHSYEQKQKLAAFALRRGFEQELIWEVLEELVS